MIIGARIKLRLDAIDATQRQLAEAIGVSRQAVSKMVTNDTTDSAKIFQIARFLQTTPEYLTGETDDTSAAAGGAADRRAPFRAPDPEPEGTDRAEIVWLKEVDQSLGMGGAYFDSPAEERLVPFPGPWLSQFRRSRLEHLRVMPATGTSMEPTINDGNLCIIDTSRKRIDEQDELWACAFGGIAVLKRLRAMPDGTVKLMSDNDRVPPETAADGELYILGRCVGVLRST